MMKHYPHHIGDFDRATRHLTRIERSVYRDLIELYYDTEQQLTLDVQALCRRIIARTNEESTSVEQVLNEFFTKTPTGWYHARCEHEIEAYRANNSQRARAGKASAEAKRLKKLQAINGKSTCVEQPLTYVGTDGNGVSTNQSTNQPINQEPKNTKPRKARSSADASASLSVDDLVAEGVAPQHAADWFKARKDKGAKTLTPSAWASVKAEAVRAGMTPAQAVQASAENQWQGFKASWLAQPSRASPQSRPPTAAQLAMAQACPSLVAPHLQQYATQHQPFAEVINADARLLD
jgi:uncharacterized protein YdaU (DUF1376 family)